MGEEQGYNSSFTGEQIDNVILTVREKASNWNGKQEKITGSSEQLVGFDSSGSAVPIDAPDEITNMDILKLWKGGI